MKTIHVRFPNLGGKSYNQAAKQNELKLITKVKKNIQKEEKKEHSGFAGGRAPADGFAADHPAANFKTQKKKKAAKTFVLE